MRAALALPRPALAAARLRSALAPGPRLRRRLIVVAALALLLAAFYAFWLRDSSLVAVERVEVTGLTSRDSDRVRSAITSVAEEMTTLHLDTARLEETAQAFPVVRAIQVTPDFPNGLHVEVIEHRPAAYVVAAGKRTPVAGDGSVLVGLPVEGSLPTIELSSGALPVGELAPGAARTAARVAGAAPAAILGRLEAVALEPAPRGVVVQVTDGPEIVFGAPTRLAAKWAAAVRVLADEDAAGAAYVDVRIPGRPAAGGLPVETLEPVAPVGGETLATTPDGTAVVTPEVPVDGLAEPTAETPVEAPTPSVEAPVPTPSADPLGGGGGATASPQP